MSHKVLAVAMALVLAGAMFMGARPSEAKSNPPAPPEAAVAQFPGAEGTWVYEQVCDGGFVTIRLAWQSFNTGLQWIDLSLFNNNFAFGTFVGVGPMPPGQFLFEWGGLLPGRAHYLRINTLTQFGWFPSGTLQFFTRADCFAVIDTDGDGVPNNVDLCPTLPGPAFTQGCPTPIPPPPPPPPSPLLRCDPVTGWCPGQPAPLSRCPNQVMILIFPPPPIGCVWPTKGEGASYANGETIRICYWVNQPMNILVRSQRPDGFLVNNAGPGTDDGRGDCVDGVVGTPPVGQRTVRLYTGPNFDQLLDTTTWSSP